MSDGHTDAMRGQFGLRPRPIAVKPVKKKSKKSKKSRKR